MARGWESKSVEAQQDEVNQRLTAPKPRLKEEDKERIRARERLRLSLESVRQQFERSSDERYRAVLKRAAEDLEKQIRQTLE